MTVTCEALRWIPLVQPSFCCSSQEHLFNAYLHIQIDASNEQVRSASGSAKEIYFFLFPYFFLTSTEHLRCGNAIRINITSLFCLQFPGFLLRILFLRLKGNGKDFFRVRPLHNLLYFYS